MEVSGYKWTSHARSRMQERFPTIDRNILVNRASIAKSKLKRKILEQCPVSASIYYPNGSFNGRYILVNKKMGVAIVCAAPDLILTVFSYRESD